MRCLSFLHRTLLLHPHALHFFRFQVAGTATLEGKFPVSFDGDDASAAKKTDKKSTKYEILVFVERTNCKVTKWQWLLATIKAGECVLISSGKLTIRSEKYAGWSVPTPAIRITRILYCTFLSFFSSLFICLEVNSNPSETHTTANEFLWWYASMSSRFIRNRLAGCFIASTSQHSNTH